MGGGGGGGFTGILVNHGKSAPEVCKVNYGVDSVPKIEIFYEGEIFHDIPRYSCKNYLAKKS